MSLKASSSSAVRIRVSFLSSYSLASPPGRTFCIPLLIWTTIWLISSGISVGVMVTIGGRCLTSTKSI